jgi:hypothetical protein
MTYCCDFNRHFDASQTLTASISAKLGRRHRGDRENRSGRRNYDGDQQASHRPENLKEVLAGVIIKAVLAPVVALEGGDLQVTATI